MKVLKKFLSTENRWEGSSITPQTHLWYPNTVFVHPAQIPHGKRAVLIYRGLIILCGLAPAYFVWLIGDTKTMIVVVANFNERIYVPLSGGPNPLRDR